jgi:hypothetical protein
MATKSLGPKQHDAGKVESISDEQRALIKAMLKGELGVGLSENFVHDRAMKFYTYEYVVPVSLAHSKDAAALLNGMLANLPEDMRGMVTFSVSEADEAVERLSGEQCFYITLECGYHRAADPGSDALRSTMNLIGDVLLDRCSPHDIAVAYAFVKQRRAG